MIGMEGELEFNNKEVLIERLFLDCEFPKELRMLCMKLYVLIRPINSKQRSYLNNVFNIN